MQKIVSRIKTMFDEDLLRQIAAICDNKRIPSNNKKMIILGNLLYTNNVDFEILGGATNRIVLQIDGYAVKFAMDEQGYVDNLIEYSLSPELQPYVTKSYETNGYIQIQECVEVMTKQAFQLYRVEINKILDSLCQDYLLGDVGYIEKNRTNWGVRTEGNTSRPVILDYAYCHRATENLFTCDICGSPLKYDSVYDKLMCSDRSACKAIYTYNDRKRVQGEQVDIDMIEERKVKSIKLVQGEISKEIEMFEDMIVGDNYFIIDNPGDYHKYMKLMEEQKMKVEINGGDDMITLQDRFDAMVRLAQNPEDVEAKKILITADAEEDLMAPIYTENYQENFMGETSPFRFRKYELSNEEVDEEEEDDFADNYDPISALDKMIMEVRKEKKEEEEHYQKIGDTLEKEYLDSLNDSQEEPSENNTEEVTIEFNSMPTPESKSLDELADKMVDKFREVTDDEKVQAAIDSIELVAGDCSMEEPLKIGDSSMKEALNIVADELKQLADDSDAPIIVAQHNKEDLDKNKLPEIPQDTTVEEKELAPVETQTSTSVVSGNSKPLPQELDASMIYINGVPILAGEELVV